VSIATVSRAIHMPEKVTASTRQKVNRAIAVTGYTVHAMARNLRQPRIAIGRTAMAMLPGILDGVPPERNETLLMPDPIVRSSVTAPDEYRSPRS
jgi:DNA-binding LacI/PurR family transcriptional regulator